MDNDKAFPIRGTSYVGSQEEWRHGYQELAFRGELSSSQCPNYRSRKSYSYCSGNARYVVRGKGITIMDMEQGFHQIRMDPKKQHKTAFRAFAGQ